MPGFAWQGWIPKRICEVHVSGINFKFWVCSRGVGDEFTTAPFKKKNGAVLCFKRLVVVSPTPRLPKKSSAFNFF